MKNKKAECRMQKYFCILNFHFLFILSIFLALLLNSFLFAENTSQSEIGATSQSEIGATSQSEIGATSPADTLEVFTIQRFLIDYEAMHDTLQVIDTEETVWDSLYYDADFLHYFVDMEKILLSGNAQVRYHSSTIKADSISIDFENNHAVASGRVIMEDGQQLIIGRAAYYDIETETGIVFDGGSSFDQGYYYGDEIRKVGDNIFDLDNGRFTTCDCIHPHFDIRSWSMRLYHDEVIVGRPIFFYVNEFPILALPYAAFSVKSGRSSGFLMPEPGYNSTDGKYLNDLAYYLVFNDYSDILFKMDFKEKTGVDFTIDFVYLDRYNYNGRFAAFYKYRRSDPDMFRDDWNLQYRHFQRLPEKATFDVTLDFASSRQVWESDNNPDNRFREEIRSSVSYRRPMASSSFFAAAEYRENLIDNKKDIVLPRFSYSLPSRPIHELIPMIPDDVRRQDHWWKTFSMRWAIDGNHTGTIIDENPTLAQILWENKMDEEGNYLSQHNAVLRQRLDFSWNYTALGWLRLSSSLNYNDALFDRDREGNIFVHGYSYGTTSSASFNVYGVQRYNRGPVVAARHILTPSASFRYSPDFTDNQKFYNTGGISSSRKARNLNLSLDQRWQFRLTPDRLGAERRLNDLFVLRSSSGYNFEAETQPWSDISHTFTINPGSYEVKGVRFGLNQNLSATQRVYENFDVSSWRSNTTFNLSGNATYMDYFPIVQNDFLTQNLFQEREEIRDEHQIMTIQEMERLESPGSWSLSSSFDYNYDKRTKNSTQNLRNNLTLKLTQNWAVRYSNYYDITGNQMRSQSIQVDRSIHCWGIALNYTQHPNYWDVSLRLFNIQIPDLRLRHSERA